MAYMSKKRLSDSSVVPIGSNLYGTCSTASGTSAKVVSMPDFNVLVEGVTIHVYFANKNTASSPTLKVGSTDAKPIRYNGQADGSWENGSFISFTYYNGSWIQNDITIGGVTYTFTIDDHTLVISGSDGSEQRVTLPDNDTTYTISISGDVITLTDSNGTPQTITVPTLKYTKDAPDGTTTNNVIQNDVNNNIASGGYSIAEGMQTEASGLNSHAEGYLTQATNERCHAEGNESVASGLSAHAEGVRTLASGNHSHAEGGDTVASGSASHAEGSHTEASGIRSFAGNRYTIAQRADQTAIGRFNIADTQGDTTNDYGKYAFIIGNGTYDNETEVMIRSNALTVDWNGNVEMALNTTATSGTDKAIYDALVALGWTDVIV